MINLREIRETIDELKRNGQTISAAERLAMLYIVEERLEREEAGEMRVDYAQEYSAAPSTKTENRIETDGKSEFLSACDGARIEDVLEIMDEHMEAIKVLYPKEYRAIVRQLDGRKMEGF